MLNKVVARYADGRMIKGMTADFFPNKELFHVSEAEAPSDAEPIEVRMKDLKALFFVKDYAGNPGYAESKEFERPAVGRRIRVQFVDGEVLIGITQGYQPGRTGFFVEPADAGSNNERCYVVSAATSNVSFL